MLGICCLCAEPQLLPCGISCSSNNNKKKGTNLRKRKMMFQGSAIWGEQNRYKVAVNFAVDMFESIVDVSV